MSTHSEGFVYETIYCGKNEKTNSSSTGEKTENKTAATNTSATKLHLGL